MGNPGEDHLSLPIMRPEPAGILGVGYPKPKQPLGGDSSYRGPRVSGQVLIRLTDVSRQLKDFS